MRDNFYCWLALALFMAMFFGAAVGKASLGVVNVHEAISSGLVVIGATICAVCCYRDAITAKESK